MIVSPKVRGFICTTAHPLGCQKNVANQINFVKSQPSISEGPKNVLVIGSSTGYGLASRIVAGFGAQAKTLGVFFEKESNGKKTATPGWYNSSFFEQEAEKSGLYAKSINGDAFSNSIKEQVIETIKSDLGGKIDLVVYSLAAPRRQHPNKQEVFNSTLKPIGNKYTNKTVNVIDEVVSNIDIEPANDQEIQGTIEVMGGEDWELWINSLLEADVLSENCKTVAYSYIGPELTYPIYRHGTIGKAKEHLEETAKNLNNKLNKINGNAFISVNKGLVTQASSAIPVVPLYISILYKVMKKHGVHEGCIEQIYRLFSQLYNQEQLLLDSQGRIRIDNLEMQENIQQEVQQIWEEVSTDNLTSLTDIAGYKDDFYGLFGFNVPSIDYTKDVDIDVKIPSLK
ncbi:MAG: trans-2-enoyl-CoA reductase family protein [Legionellales bacterium]|nr:trans-2-enoyl-CoA reductase family protein [Legionellales bacterium]